MGSGYFPLENCKWAERLMNAVKEVRAVCVEARDDIYSGESGGGQFDIAASDGESLAMLYLAIELIERQISGPLLASAEREVDDE